MRKSFAALAALLLSCTAAPVLAAGPTAPEPHKTVDLDRFMGRWYEIYRTPNVMETNCYGAFQIWTRMEPGKFSIPLFCHRDSATGDEHKVSSTARVLDAPANTKFTASFFGGLLHHDYWVLDHADDYGWMIASTSDGKYSSILARQPGLSKREGDALVARAASMGLNTGKLVHVGADVD